MFFFFNVTWTTEIYTYWHTLTYTTLFRSVGDQPRPLGPQQQAAHAAEQHRARQRRHLLAPHPLAQHGEGLAEHAVGRRQVVGLVEIDGVDLRAGQESLDADHLVALRHHLGDLLRLQDDVLVLAGLVALHLLLALDRLAGLLVDVLAVHAIARLAVQDVKGHALGRRRPRVERDRKSQLRNFHVTLPGCPGRHG